MSGFSSGLVSRLLKNRFQFRFQFWLCATSVSRFKFRCKFYPRKLFSFEYGPTDYVRALLLLFRCVFVLLQ